MSITDLESAKRWRLILGKAVEDKFNPNDAEFLSDLESQMDVALSLIYGSSDDSDGKQSSINLSKWLTDVRSLFPTDIVSIIQNDAIERKGLKQLLFEPETLKNIKPDISMVSTLLALKGQIPQKSKETARELVKAVVKEIQQRLEMDLKRAVTGALNKRAHTVIPSLTGLDWKRTINKNLKNYNQETKRLSPQSFYFFERQNKSKDWTIILDIDQSGSMSESIIYSSVMASIFASMPSLDTHVIAFDTNIVDLTELVKNDPVDMLYGIQLGGGTDINKSVRYCSELITNPKKTIFILISDLYEGGVESALLQKLNEMHESGVKCIVLLALSDQGSPSYDETLGKKITRIGIPAFACTPNRLPILIENALKGNNLIETASKLTSKSI